MTNTIHWNALDQFEDEWRGASGQHVILMPDESNISITVNKMVSKNLSSGIIISFLGAVANPKLIGPGNLMKNMILNQEMPIIHVTDPLIQGDSDLRLAWYTGQPRSAFTRNLVDVFRAIQRYSGKELIFAGGNGGGFAALEFGRIFKDPSSVVTWDAHTDIYTSPDVFVKPYLKEQFNFSNATLQGKEWKAFCKKRTYSEINTSVNSLETIFSPDRLIFMQDIKNEIISPHTQMLWKCSDSKPLTAGVNKIDNEHVFVLKDYTSDEKTSYFDEINKILFALTTNGSMPDSL